MFHRTFSSLKHRNYRLFFFGQLVSLVGTWMQMTAQQWLVYDLTRSKVSLGIVAAASTVPMLLFSVFGGMAADRWPKRTLLVYTQAVMMASAFALGLLTLLGSIEVWQIALLAFVTGVGVAFDMPTRQAFVVEMVGPDDLMNAIGLNSAIFNGARMVGPALAGLVMAETNVAYCFLLNGVSFFAVLFGLALMRLKPAERGPEHPARLRKDLADVVAYVHGKKEVLRALLAAGLLGVFGWSLPTLAPVYARDLLAVGEKGYGFLLTCGGIGALLAALSVASVRSPERVRRITVAGILIFSVSAGIFAASRGFALSMISFGGAMFGVTASFVSANTFIQLQVPHTMRGAVMGIWTLVFGGTAALGSLQIGFIGETLGPRWAVLTGAVICLAAVRILKN